MIRPAHRAGPLGRVGFGRLDRHCYRSPVPVRRTADRAAPALQQPADDVVSVVIVHWNQPERCSVTLERLSHQGVPVFVTVVDNGSSAESLARLRAVVAGAEVPAEIIELGANTGFGPASNAGLRRWLARAGGEWAVVMPHDALPDDDTLKRLTSVAEEQPRAGLACADVGDGHIPVHDPYFGGMTVPGGGDGGWEDVDYPHGTLMLLRRSCVDDIGLFDERYFAYCEEADLGARARDAGWQVGLVRGVGVTNPSMRSGSPVVDYLMHRNTLLLVREHAGRYHATIRFVIALFQLVRGLVDPSARPLLFDARGRFRGLVDFARGRFGPPPADLLS
jgi:N-acetylglucosaminyl-diphospho-decaprenol L-rhamnosyltransferase